MPNATPKRPDIAQQIGVFEAIADKHPVFKITPRA
jgi:hypothetical protein